ncbi:hypothetical protein CWM92_26700, partial [Klebsiella michiganensis]
YRDYRRHPDGNAAGGVLRAAVLCAGETFLHPPSFFSGVSYVSFYLSFCCAPDGGLRLSRPAL